MRHSLATLGLVLCLLGCATSEHRQPATVASARTISLHTDPLAAENCPPLSEAKKTRLVDQHVFGGPPSRGALLVRRAYVTSYDAPHRVPRWTAWEATPAFRETPARTGRWATFRIDDEVGNPVRSDDYNGLEQSRLNLARGHMAPYFISGGDRDGDGRLAERDIDDACTIYEINFMSDIAPQNQDHLNGSGGLWGNLESKLRSAMTRGRSFHVIADDVTPANSSIWS